LTAREDARLAPHRFRRWIRHPHSQRRV